MMIVSLIVAAAAVAGATDLVCYLRRREIVNFGCGGAMDIFALVKQFDHFFVLAHVRDNAQINLRIISAD